MPGEHGILKKNTFVVTLLKTAQMPKKTERGDLCTNRENDPIYFIFYSVLVYPAPVWLSMKKQLLWVRFLFLIVASLDLPLGIWVGWFLQCD